ncbi:MAG: hypothetical protein A3D24_04105 [Candidatus Blackburnbacteria bacterium RIFCSPHIGHO2_02_FULL_39_13]|uniref:Uncharacterized protein n=1 Tax=Candidatus Blackburnbacteria bacterium RIFCSPLOWO2_01_FULL_40_20 TaxID=1797519 RepID=A0A1G1VAL1_9BACT|nr:MAG: hypothetical protein A2694_02680 [Candidatus Blackburnbacteria bacterium RIFCSPHIGHO2_01_FULL_40_17]OGY08414.1 MAG: hypothetical protein A3D24_04105 [Candidatus Blackburnbacteria bacterium RIFCSPHIGHO2_02_FULL_39_13]OGY12490.1 MAG: hypothetical protein A3A77_00755 [Candidatus Blackburnbacteria bacterium RIFCSPLOWO2_01_FULL_40_20]HBL52128.1 hypothetical protein [Candidatus Blackburnbacteria bacterium]
MKYFINSLAVLFCPQLDQKNNYKTIVFNSVTEEIIKVNKFGYNILRTIDENPGIGIEEIYQLLKVDVSKIGKFLGTMSKENIIIEK